MIEKPVNKIDINGNVIKANDVNTVINIKITDVNNNPVNLENEIDYFYLVRNNKYYPVTDITFSNGEISFKLPNLYKGLYKIEIKDTKGSIYPANDDISILLNQSFESGKETEFISMKDSILKDVPEILNDYIIENEDKLKGEDGKDGKDGKDGRNGIDGKDGKNGIDGKDGKDGIDGKDGENGADSDGFISILEFGAIGNGLSDDTEYFELANSENLNVYLPKGYVFIVDNLTLENISVNGQGTLKRKDMSVNPMVRLSGHCTINGVKFIGNKDNQDSVNRTIIPIENAGNSVIENCTFSDFTSTLLNVYQSSPDVTIKNCQFHDTTNVNNGNIITIRSENCLIENNTFKEIGNGHCILLGLRSTDDLNLPVNNTMIKNNYFENTEHNAVTVEMYTTNTSVLNNYFLNNPQAIKCEHEDNTVKGVLIDGNTFRNISLRTALNLVVDDVVFINNNAKDLQGGAFFGNNYICGNNIFDNVGAIDGYSVSEITGAKGLIFGNIIRNATYNGILTQNSSVKDNKIDGCVNEGLRITGDGAVVLGNIFTDNKYGINAVSTVKNAIISNNNFKNNENNISITGSSRETVSILNNNNAGISDNSHGIFQGTTFSTGSVDIPHNLGVIPTHYNVNIESDIGSVVVVTSVNSVRIRCTVYDLEGLPITNTDVKLVWETKK